LKPISYLEIGPGGATNIAIMAARFGLQVECIGEVGRDSFGDIVRAGLEREGIGTHDVITTPETKTPVAGVLVDQKREPAYLGYMGHLTVHMLPEAWREKIVIADALFADGWVEIPEMPTMILDSFRIAQDTGVPVFFDPGPGNSMFDLGWHSDAATLATVLLVNEEEAMRLSGLDDAPAASRELLRRGAELVVLKQGARGMTLVTKDNQFSVEGYSVTPVDFTGAGDSVTGAILYGYLGGMNLGALGILGNATGATKVTKLGTGHNMPTLAEIRATLNRFAPEQISLLDAKSY
jgi:sugar/nucleoside kinase (ribokinase family)